jgi:hypothetical protein
MNAAGVRKELERILASPGFDASARNRRFLEYIVQETLGGRADRLKGLTIAIDVFGRDATIDPQHDPVVRIEAAKLRHPIRIDISRGTYVPTFERRVHPSLDAPAPAGEPAAAVVQPLAPRGAKPRWYWLTTGLLAGLLLGVLGWFGTELLASRSWSGGSQDAVTDLPRVPRSPCCPS